MSTTSLHLAIKEDLVRISRKFRCCKSRAFLQNIFLRWLRFRVITLSVLTAGFSLRRKDIEYSFATRDKEKPGFNFLLILLRWAKRFFHNTFFNSVAVDAVFAFLHCKFQNSFFRNWGNKLAPRLQHPIKEGVVWFSCQFRCFRSNGFFTINFCTLSNAVFSIMRPILFRDSDLVPLAKVSSLLFFELPPTFASVFSP